MTMKNRNYRSFFVALILCVALSLMLGMSSEEVVSKAQKKPAPKTLLHKLITLLPKKKLILGSFTYNQKLAIILCTGPDKVKFKARKLDCDNLNAYWAAHLPPPAQHHDNGSSNSGSSSSNNAGSGSSNNPAPSPTASPTPIVSNDPTITSVTVLPCSSSSCSGFLTTVVVTGTNFTANARVAISSDGKTYSEQTAMNFSPKDATYSGGDGDTKIITDFYNLPKGKTYDVTVYFPAPQTRTVGKTAAFSL